MCLSSGRPVVAPTISLPQKQKSQDFLSWDFSYMIFAKPIEPTTVSIPDTAIERLLIAPSISPSSIALAVPIA